MLQAAILLRVHDSLGPAKTRPDAVRDATGRAVVSTVVSVVGGATTGLFVLTTGLAALPQAPSGLLLRALPFALYFVFFGTLLALPTRWRGGALDGEGAPASVRLEITDAGITFRSAHAVSQHAWDSFETYGETQRAFTLFASSGLVHVIPKRALVGRGSVRAFRSLLRANILERRSHE
jgi:hypothetical protein